MKFFNGFLAYVREIPSPVCGENYDGVVSKTIPDDDVCIADVVRRMQRGEIVPLKQLPYGDDTDSQNDIVDDEIMIRNGLQASSESDESLMNQESTKPAAVESHDDKSTEVQKDEQSTKVQ